MNLNVNDPSSVDPTLGLQQTIKLDTATGTSSVSTSAGSGEDPGSVGKSDRRRAEEDAREMAGLPVLPPPPQNLIDYDFSLKNLLAVAGMGHDKTDKTKKTPVAFQFEIFVAQAAIKMLTAWIENLEKMGETQNAAKAISDIKKQIEQSVKQNEKLAEQKDEASESVASYGLLLAAGLFAVGLAQGVVPGVASIAAVQAINAIISSIVPIALDSVIASMISLFGAGVVIQTGIMVLRNSDSQNDEFAKQYALRALQVAGGSDLDAALKAISGPVGETTLVTKIGLSKVAFLAQSLAFTYHLDHKWISGDVFGQMLESNPFQKNDYRYDLIQAILYHLSTLPNRSAVVEQLKAYYQSNPDLKELMEPANAIRSMLHSHYSLPLSSSRS